MTKQILDGNELIVEGGLEAGFSLYTGYPGSPLADYFNILYKKRRDLKTKGIQVAIANSEANAAAMASGAKQAGRDCLVAMKSMGLHVASDALSVGNFANPGPKKRDSNTGEELSPGTVVVVGDDPWSMSTSTPADSRYLYKHLHIPFLEPATPQELKDWIKVALEISKRTSLYQGLLLTTFMAEGGGRVELGEHKKVDGHTVHLDPNNFDLSKNVMVPPNSLLADVSMINERFPKVQEVLKRMNLDQHLGNKEAKTGFISSGVIYETLKQVLEQGDYLKSFSLYKLACSYPLVEDLIVPYLQSLDNLIIVEEKRGFLEEQIASLCQKHQIKLNIFGKQFADKEGFPAHGGLTYEMVASKISEAFIIIGVNPCELKTEILTLDEQLPRRLPTFCPGCPHRETLSLLKDLRSYLKENENVNLISHGDVGCYSLSFLEPFKEMHNLSAMGQGGALGAGVDMFTDNPSIVLMGDSTFFHSGLTDISNSVQMGHNITYILLDNDNTAMTGHQMTPASGVNVKGDSRSRQSMLSVANSLGVDSAIEVNPSDRYFYQNVLREHVLKPGVKVIVSNKECGLTFHGRRKAQERKHFSENKTIESRSFYQINTDACEDCRACVEMTGCPGLSQGFDAYGTKVTIDPQICVADSYCTKIKACPSFELVEVTDYHPDLYRGKSNLDEDYSHLPEPTKEKTFDTIAGGDDLRVVVTGVGGSGVTTISRVIAEAAKKMGGREDLDFKFMDQKGLAQRNGNVTGYLSIFKKGLSRGAVIPLGSADLVLSPDLLDGSSKINFLGPKGLSIYDRFSQIPLSILMDKGEHKPPLTDMELASKLEKKLGSRLILASMKELSNLALSKSVYASAMVLGLSYQSGKLPFSLDDMREALKSVTRKEEFANNWTAFNLGREVFIEGDEKVLKRFRKNQQVDEIKLLKESLVDSLFSKSTSSALLVRFDESLQILRESFSFIRPEYLARYIHDLMIFDRGKKLKDFVEQAKSIPVHYQDTLEQQMALRTLAKTYWIKDEVMVAHLMISPMRKIKDEQEYSKLGKSYSKTFINRPSFDIGSKKVEFDISPKVWMLKGMRHLRVLRKLLPKWHAKEKDISIKIRHEILNEAYKLTGTARYSRLKQLENVKGYREYRYRNAQGIL